LTVKIQQNKKANVYIANTQDDKKNEANENKIIKPTNHTHTHMLSSQLMSR